MRAVNLLPRDAERVRADGARTPLLVAAGGVAIVTAAAVMMSISASGAATDRRAELAALDAAAGLVQNGRPPAVTQAALTQERTDRVAALAASLQTRVPFDRLLREISLVLPEDAWLTGITASAPAPTTPSAPSGTTPPASPVATQGVTIQGATYSHESVARVLARLSVIPSLEGVRLTASARVEPPEETAVGDGKKKKKKQRTVVAFTLAAALPTGGAS